MAPAVYQWHTFYGSYDSEGDDVDEGWSVAVDGNGNVYLVGHSLASWNGPEGQAPLHEYGDYWDIVVVKLDSNGAYQWHTFYGADDGGLSNADHDEALDVAVDGSGNVYVVGWSKMGWQGPLGQLPLRPHNDAEEIVVLKLNSSGAYQWHTFYGSPRPDTGHAIVVDDSGGVYVVGGSENGWLGDGGTLPLQPHAGSTDIALLKLDTDGAYQWHTFYGSNYWDQGREVAVDGSYVYVTGESLTTWNSPSLSPPLHNHSGGDSNDIVVVKADSDGDFQWHTFYGE